MSEFEYRCRACGETNMGYRGICQWCGALNEHPKLVSMDGKSRGELEREEREFYKEPTEKYGIEDDAE